MLSTDSVSLDLFLSTEYSGYFYGSHAPRLTIHYRLRGHRDRNVGSKLQGVCALEPDDMMVLS